MSRYCLDARLIGSKLLEERVICLQIQHARAFSIGQRATRRLLCIQHIHNVVLDIQIDIMLRMIYRWKLIVVIIVVAVRMMLTVRRIVVGINQIRIVIVNDNAWLFGWAVFGNYFDMCFVIRSRTSAANIHLLIRGRKVIVDPIIITEHIREHIAICLCDDVAQIVIAIRIITVD